MIYILEDDASIRKLVVYTIQSQGMEAEGFERPSQFWEALEQKTPELVLLDIMLPEEDGLQVLKRLRSLPATKGVPIIMLTAKSTEYDKVLGLDEGADDYVAKPFRPRELVARVHAAIRRARPERSVMRLGPVTIDLDRARAEKGGQDVPLSALEYRLLLLFAKNAGRIVTRDMIRDALWDDAGAYVEENTLSVYIKRLRDKLEVTGLTKF